MAITAEQIQSIVAGSDGNVTEQVKSISETLLKAFNEDVQGLKATNAALKDEKTEVMNKLRAEQDRYRDAEANYNKQLAEAQEQIKKANPEEARKYFEDQKQILESGYRAQIEKKDTTINELSAEIENFKKKEIFNSMKDEFRKAAVKAKVAQDSLDVLQMYILGADGNNFTPKDTSEGRIFWSTDASGETIESRLDKFLKTPGGKRFLPFDSSGSGADAGSSTGSLNGQKALTMAEFNKLSPSERQLKMREGYKIID